MKMTVTHIDKRREAIQAVGNTIVAIMGFSSELRLNYFIMERGWLWIRLHMKGDKDAIAFMETHHLFWKWWRNQWVMRDEWLLEDADNFSKVNREQRRAYYRGLHNPMMLHNPETEWGKRMYDSYAVLIKNINKGL